MAKKMDDWEIGSAVDTLIEAQEILKDKKNLPRIEKEFKKRQDAMAEAALELQVAKKQKAMHKEC